MTWMLNNLLSVIATFLNCEAVTAEAGVRVTPWVGLGSSMHTACHNLLLCYCPAFLHTDQHICQTTLSVAHVNGLQHVTKVSPVWSACAHTTNHTQANLLQHSVHDVARFWTPLSHQTCFSVHATQQPRCSLPASLIAWQ